MKLLLDTHVAIWMLKEPERLKPDVRDALDDPSNALLISAGVLWEAAIKMAQGKLEVPDDFPSALERLGCLLLPVTAEHAWSVRHLPRLHGDPFDRVLIAQALVEDAVLVTRDEKVLLYGCKLWEA